MRSVVTLPVIELLQFVPVMFASVPLHRLARRAFMIFGLANPIDTWYPAGPNSWKKLGSPMRRNESCAFCPSRVLVCSHSSPRAMRSAAGVATTPYLPGIRLAITAWPASGERVVPSASYFGQVTMVLVMPVGLAAPKFPLVVSMPTRSLFEIGQASTLLFAGSGVPAKLFDRGWLNMSYVIWPVASPVPPASSNNVILNPPRPGSLGDSTSTPPPPSCSPLSGKSSSKTKTESFDGG